MLASVISVRLMTRHLGTGDWGAYSVVTAITFVLVGSSEAGLTSLGLREGATLDEMDRSRLLANILGLRIFLTLLGVVAAVIFALATGRDQTIVLGVAIVGAGTLFTMTQQTLAIKLSLELRNTAIAALELLRNLALAGTNIAFVLVGARLDWFYLAPALAGLTAIAAMLVFVRSRGSFRPRFEPSEWRRVLRGVLPYAIAGAVALLYFRVAQIAMNFVASPTDTGIYGLAFRVIEVLGAIPSLVAITALPLLSRAAIAGRDRLQPMVQVLTESAAIAGITLAFAVAAGAHLAIRVLGDASYAGATPVLRILAVGLAFTFPLAMLSILLLTLSSYRTLIVGGTAAAFISLALTVLLVPRFGARGAASATVVTEVLLMSFFLLSLAISDRSLVPRPQRTARALVASVPAGVELWLTLDSAAVFLPLLSVPIFVVSLFLLRAIPPELRDVARPLGS